MNKTIPEQLSDALAEVVALRASNADSSVFLALKNERDSFAAQNAALVAENTDLKAKLVTAESGIQGAITKALANARAEMDKTFELRVSDRAVEIMASVGQPTPIRAMPNSGQPTSVGTVPSGRFKVEEEYREKYGIT